ncbi:hypothetical protein ColLi_03568 [Colletotrichum liriopes]|uniref:Uncharacterized protein n=1 Tax=Colletotrichum liriopes TaxID=708192 RepID=A0AA37GHI5_9PEZI|nr:hypothetical protein ColLi_03568 [Colletotrichum liriopes]
MALFWTGPAFDDDNEDGLHGLACHALWHPVCNFSSRFGGLFHVGWFRSASIDFLHQNTDIDRGAVIRRN